MAAHTPFDADVLIVGAGPAGLTLGAAMADIGLQVTLLEQQGTAALQDPPEGGREIRVDAPRAARDDVSGPVQPPGCRRHRPAERGAGGGRTRAPCTGPRRRRLEVLSIGQHARVLPLDDRICSEMVTLPAGRTPERLGLPDAAFAARIAAQSDGRLGALHAAGPRHHAPPVGVDAQRVVAPRFALIGDAAGGTGEWAPLPACEREHRRTTVPVWRGTNAIVSLFTDDRRPAKPVRRAVLTVTERAPGPSRLLKAAIERQLTGGALSAAAA